MPFFHISADDRFIFGTLINFSNIINITLKIVLPGFMSICWVYWIIVWNAGVQFLPHLKWL